MAQYKRCKEGDCKRGQARRPGSPTSGTPPEDILITASAAPASAAGATPVVKPCADPCRCFIVARHWTKSGDTMSFDEKTYPASAADPDKCLTKAAEKANHPPKPGPGITTTGTATDYWTVTAECLEVDGNGAPLTAMAFQLHLPDGEYASLHSELIRRFGKHNVEELPLPVHPEEEVV